MTRRLLALCCLAILAPACFATPATAAEAPGKGAVDESASLPGALAPVVLLAGPAVAAGTLVAGGALTAFG